MEIREIERDALTPAELASVTRLANLVDPEHLPGDPPMPEEMVYDLLHPDTRFEEHRAWVVLDGGEVVAFAEAGGAIGRENPELWEVTIAVDPKRRREGLGRTLFEHVRRVGADAGRTRLWAWGPLRDDTRGFWERGIGLALGYEERVSRCVLAEVDAELMQAWIDRAPTRASDYHLVRWEGRCPDVLIERFASARESMSDAPLDALDFDDERFDVERMRDKEGRDESRGLLRLTVMALHTPSGDPGGYTTIMIPRHRPAISWQWDTVTIDAHRNRGIGRWIKADMYQWVRRDHPEVRSLDTGNAESNDAMLAINEAMGFRPLVTEGVWH